MESRLCRKAVVIGVNAFDGERNLEISLEDKIFEVERFAIFLDGFWPLRLSKVDPFCR